MKKLLYIISIVIVTAGAIGVYLFVKNSDPVPKSIQEQVDFAIFYPTAKEAKIDRSTYKYDSSLKSLSFIVDFMGRKITFAEQSSPESFVDDPNFYPKFAEKLNSYLTFDSINGRVDLTRPTKSPTQTGVMYANGTLLFAKSDGDISEEDWKKLFNSLVFTKPN